MKRVVLINVLVIAVAFTAGMFWSDHHAEAAAARAIAKHEKQEFEFWKRKLVPMYHDMVIQYPKDPQTKEDLFGPLFGLLERVDE